MFELCLVTDEKACKGRPLPEVVAAAVKGGVSIVQLREKELDSRHFLRRAELLLEILAPQGIPLIINDRVDIALAISADGVHVGQQDMPIPQVRELLSPYSIVGLSIENLDQGIAAQSLETTYYGVGPIFTSPTKADAAPAMGLIKLKELRAQTSRPLMAIGGITIDNAREVIQAGADGLAVVSAICSADDPEESARKLRQIVDEELRLRGTKD
ncbi:MAG: thiamine phosphate synthase [Bacteroidota bacterium]